MIKPPKPRPRIKPRWFRPVKAMTLVGGIVCSDGIVLAADTEHSDGVVKFQDHKLKILPPNPPRKHPEPWPRHAHRVAIAGAGLSDYIKMSIDDIRDKIEDSDKTVAQMKAAIKAAVEDVHATIFKYWDPNDHLRPTVSLIAALRDSQGNRMLVRTMDVSVSEVDASNFVGSGDSIARFITAGLYRPDITTSAGLHMIVQIFRAVKESGADVGGNTEAIALGDVPISALLVEDEKQEYLWGMNTRLLRAMRLMLVGDYQGAGIWIKDLAQHLEQMQKSCQNSSVSSYEDLHIVDWATGFDEPFGDVH